MSQNNKNKAALVLIIACPFCKVEAGVKCIYEPGNGEYHLSRMDAAEIQVALDKRDARIYLERAA